jgi:hypothetical protein
MGWILLIENTFHAKREKAQKKATQGWLCKSSSERGTSLEISLTWQHRQKMICDVVQGFCFMTVTAVGSNIADLLAIEYPPYGGFAHGF